MREGKTTHQQHVAASKPHESIARIIGDYVDLSDRRYAQMLAYVLDEVPEPPPQQHVNGSDDAKAKLELWFFRDMFESNRLALFSLFGFKLADMDTMAKQRLVFCSILDALATEGKS